MKKIYNHIDKINEQLEAIKNMLKHSYEHNELTLQTRSKSFVIDRDVNKEKPKA